MTDTTSQPSVEPTDAVLLRRVVVTRAFLDAEPTEQISVLNAALHKFAAQAAAAERAKPTARDKEHAKSLAAIPEEHRAYTIELALAEARREGESAMRKRAADESPKPRWTPRLSRN